MLILSAPANALAIMLIGFFRWMGFDTLLDRGRGVFLQLCKPIPVPAGSLIEDPAMPVNGSGTGTAGSSTRDPAGTSKNGCHTEPSRSAVRLALPTIQSHYANPLPVPAGSLVEDPAMPVNGSGTGTAGSSTRDPAGTSKNGYHTEPLDCGAVGLAYYTEPLCKSSFTND